MCAGWLSPALDGNQLLDFATLLGVELVIFVDTTNRRDFPIGSAGAGHATAAPTA